MVFRRKRERQPSNPDADRALADAHKNLAETRKRSSEVTEVSNALRELRERNHFREQLQIIMGG